LFSLIAIPALIIAPAAFLLYYFWIRDRWEKEPWTVLWFLFLLGCGSVIPAAVIELGFLGLEWEITTIGQVYFVAFIAIALVEEVVKFATVYIWTFKSRYFTEEYDGIIYAVTVGLGFAFLENILYVGIALLEEGPGGLATAVLRAFTAVPSHALDGVIIGYFLGRSRFVASASTRVGLLALGLIIAIIFHGLYDSFAFLLAVVPENLQVWCFIGLVWTLIVQWGVAHRLIRSAMEFSTRRWKASHAVPVMQAPKVPAGTRNFCRYCGEKLAPGSKFCTACGRQLG
jgi:RsiW-degrading membrane proteinase PrsW (M82 family)